MVDSSYRSDMPACEDFLKADASLWSATCSCAFLRKVKSGKITQQQFNAWLTQDYLFGLSFVKLAGSVLASAPTTDLEKLLAGLAALQDELQWFQVLGIQAQIRD